MTTAERTLVDLADHLNARRLEQAYDGPASPACSAPTAQAPRSSAPSAATARRRCVASSTSIALPR